MFGVPRYLIRRIVVKYAQLPFVWASFNRARVFKHLRSLAYDLGAFKQARTLTRLAKHAPADRG